MEKIYLKQYLILLLNSYLKFFFSFSLGITDMSRVTAPSLSANNWQTWFSVYLLAYPP